MHDDRALGAEVLDGDAPDDTTARARIEAELDTTLVVVAGAGTGKTTALVGRILQLVRSGRAQLREIAAITFTEAAAAELRQRIRERIEEVAAQSPTEARLVAARHEVDEAAICTLHAFAQRILVEHCVAAGIPPGFDVLDETAERADFEARFERFADVLLADPDAEEALVRGFSVGLMRVDLADMAWALHTHWDRLEDGGLEAFERLRPAPGNWPSAEPGPVLDAIDAAVALGGWCTDDSDKLKEHLDTTLAGVRAGLATCDDAQSTLRLLDGLRGLQCSYGKRDNWNDHVEEVRAACATAEKARLDLLQATRRAVLGELGARLAHFVVGAANERRAEGRLAFHDLLVHARRLLRHDGAARAALRRRYRRLLIDEFQDTDPIQVELAARLAAAVDGSADLASGEPGGLFVVGDPKQSIYRFRRADIESFARVGSEIGDAVVLVTNFRSVPGILAFVNTVFAELFGAVPVPGQAAHHALYGARAAMALRAAPSRPGAVGVTTAAPGARAEQLTLDGLGLDPPGGARTSRPVAPPPTVGRSVPGMPPVVVVGGPNRGTAAEIRRLAARDIAAAVSVVHDQRWAVSDGADGVRAARWRDVTVLLPARTGLAALEEAFEESAIPYRLEGVAMLWGSQEVRDVLAVLHAADDPADAMAVLAALRSPGLACGDDDLVSWRQADGRWDPRAEAPPGLEAHPVARAMAVLVSLHDRRWWHEPSAMVMLAFDELRSFELCLAYHRPRDHWHRLRWLVDQARLFDETVGGPLRSFLRWADLQAEDDRHRGGVGPPDPDDDAVRVMTVHGAKGLEFPVVVLAGLEREVGAGQRTPAVLWADDGTPELRARRDLKSGGYDVVSERERELDALEQHRLLYVGMTRARDHLVIGLHHKEMKAGTTATPTEAARLFDICARRPDLWRRLPAEDASTAPAPGSRSRPTEAAGPEEEDTSAWLSRRDAFEAARHEALSSRRRVPVTTATAVAERVAEGAGAGDAVARRVASAPDPGSPDATGALWRDAEVSLQVGRAVHGALAAIDLAAGTDAAGRAPAEVARGRAAAQGVGERAEDVVVMVDAALRAESVAAAAGHRHWRELFVAVPVGDGGVLEGYVDLVVEDDDGLVVVDYKTDRVDGPAGVAVAARRYGPQLASYAYALEQSTGMTVRRCVLVFVGTGDPLEHVIDGAELAAARAEALDAGAALVSSRS
ncbi:MAG: UvrD-helicase domain-containing protein [Acidimicrobiales bacterium]